MAVRRQKSFRSEATFDTNRRSFLLSGEDTDILNAVGTLAELPDFEFSGRRWRRIVDVGAAKMDSVKSKLDGQTVSVSFQQKMTIADKNGHDREIVSTSNNTFDLPPNTISNTVKASLAPGKVTVTGEVSQFKSEITFVPK
ncbi:Oidioi.mRNA.OKI2018_I69.XSR.g16456.t1.cds [Oikopleura dioica]|uniref:Oidioi.mRNA.OKI2018_I69.XSR.g16456.t1.cds n=1 Tax=Oikopleura dioica TaxID=34765 RepID=A0ABN7SKE3_OIKDI|nr:Oidioi.mRNA.OKI2018_I69.XSR.g16456.t1.cds [Oikopleura dioica]